MNMDLGSALLGLFSAVVVKGGVMVVGLWLLFKMGKAVLPSRPTTSWIHVPEDYRLEMKVVFGGLILFYIAELGCALAVLSVACPGAELFDVVHSVVSGVGMSVFGLGMYLYLDKKVLHYGDKLCLANRICRGCAIGEAAGCKFHNFIILLALFIAMVALLALWIPTDRVNLDPARVALPFESWNAWYDRVMVPYFRANVPGYEPGGKAYFIPESILFIEFRVIPAMAFLTLLVSIPYLVERRDGVALKLLILSIGLLGYAYLEIVVYRGTNDALLGSVAHEAAELWFLIALVVFLKLAFPGTDRERGVGTDKRLDEAT